MTARPRLMAGMVTFVILASLLAFVAGPADAYGGDVTLSDTAKGQTLSCTDPSCATGSVVVSGTDTMITNYVALAGQTASVNVFVTGSTCGSTSMTLKANFTISGTSAFSRIYLFYGIGFSSGATSCGITTTGATTGQVWIYATQAWSNVLQSAPIAQSAQATGTTQTNYTASVTNAPGANDLMVDWNLAMAATIDVPSPGAAQTSRWAHTIAAAIYGQGSTKLPSAVISKTMYNTVSVANAAWGQYVVDIASNFVATPPPSPPSSSGGGYVWSGGGQWANGTFNNVEVVGNCIQLTAGSTAGTWTSNVVNRSTFITDINLTYSGSTATRYVSGIAILNYPQSNVLWNADTFFWGGTQYNQNVGHFQVTQWGIRISLAGDGSGTALVCGLGVWVTGPSSQPSQDWFIFVYIILALLVIVVVAWVVIRFV